MNRLRRCKPLLGTYVEIDVAAEASERALLDATSSAFAEIERIQRLMSFHDAASELTTINRFAHLRPCVVSADLAFVLTRALALSHFTHGVFDVTVAPALILSGALPDPGLTAESDANWTDISLTDNVVRFERPLLIDLGGIAKGYAVDRAVALFDDSTEVSVNAGGDLRMTHWGGNTVGIKHPGVTDTVITVSMRAPALATSAGYYSEHGSAMISTTRAPVTDDRSFSVFADSCLMADALTKVAFLAEDSGELIRSLGAQALVINRHGSITEL